MANSVEMPYTHNINIGAEAIEKENTMASGRIVKDIVGYRTVVRGVWDYIPQESLNKLFAILRNSTTVYIEYPEINGTTGSGTFISSFPNVKLFTFRNGVPMWHNVDLTFKNTEVL